jgi:ribose transport system permease protein
MKAQTSSDGENRIDLVNTLRNYSVYILLGLILVSVTIIRPEFSSGDHLLNLLRQTAPLGVVAAGQTVAIIAGSFDLSVGATMGLVNVILAKPLFGGGAMAVVGIFLCLLVGALIGFINGIGVTKFRISPLIMTMGTMLSIQGIALMISKGAPGGAVSAIVRFFGTGKLAALPMAFIIWAGVTLLIMFILRKTNFGRMIYATGGNSRAAFMSAIRTNDVIVIAHTVCGITAALAGVMLSGYIGTGALGLGEDYMMNSIAAVVIGGTRLEGGAGNAIGSAAGAYLLLVLISLFSMFNLGYPIKLILQGGIIVMAMTMYRRSSIAK